MQNNYSYKVSRDSKPAPEQQLELDLGLSKQQMLKAQQYIDTRYFSIDEINDILHLFETCGHRHEVKMLIRNIHNWSDYPNTEMGSLLLYADKKSRSGIFTLMDKFAEGKSLDQLLNQDFLYEQF
ncbi:MULTISPECIES: hypothetical protein [Vibrio]|uniref:hypothetical protein n=1 Tax=Vibrio TaxID=662 RepID=UPI0002FD989B|nr:hypothetical protein [Vibrio splendidus]MDH5932665.1 hypothetical protein [Vibrio splendidus]OED84121.1 hypothetical protein A144_14350 [Vibrio splendidus ZF-90]PTP34716.1 hypothetical protein CWN95_12580 [Vibrio splendidus]